MRILVLAPHTDDMELGCGGTVSRMVGEGHEVREIIFSWLGDGILYKEATESAKLLGVKVKFCEYPVRNIWEYRQYILEGLVKEKKPDIVFLPAMQDVHQDHQVITMEGIRAFKYSSILGYELPWNNFTWDGKGFIGLAWKDVEKKIEAIKIYKSQSERVYANPDIITGLARLRGVQAGMEYAESFQVIKGIYE